MVSDLAALTAAEVDCLADCEQRIERGLKTFVEVGTSLATIRDNRLYRAEFGTFEAYCAARWGFTDRRARQIMEAAEIGRILPVTNAGQAAELARVPEPDRADIWRETVERTEGKPTAAAIRETYERTQTPAITPEPEPDGTDVAAGSGHDHPRPSAGEAESAAAFPLPPTQPDPHAEDDARRDAELAAELAGTAARFRANFSTTVARADDLWQFDVDRIVEVYATDYDRAVRPFLDEMTRWIERVEQARRRQTSGLRLVNGGNR